MQDEFYLSETDRFKFKIAVTMEYSKMSGVPMEDAVQMFIDNNIYQYLDDGADQFINRTYRYMARDVADEFNLPMA
jgi:hypothetical protein